MAVPTTDFDVAIVGAGIIGLACANRFAQSGKRVLVLEQHAHFGEETSSRNSGVIHAGLYYPGGSLKAESCVAGRELLYTRCKRLGIPHRKTGKLVVATNPEEEQWLHQLRARALSNRAGAVRLLGRAELNELESHVRAIAALYSPESGIVDVHALMYSHQVEARDAGAIFSFQSQVLGLGRRGHGWEIEVQAKDADRFSVTAAVVINAAGLHAEKLTRLAGVDTHALGYRYHWCKGDYFSVAPRHRDLVRHLVYPVPSHAGLGIHITLGLDGSLNAGPDTQYVEQLQYDVRDDKRSAFARALQRYLPAIRAEDLTPGYAGIRPKLQGPGDPFRDFVVAELGSHGAPGFIALLGIESPGLTASEALSQQVETLLSG